MDLNLKSLPTYMPEDELHHMEHNVDHYPGEVVDQEVSTTEEHSTVPFDPIHWGLSANFRLYNYHGIQAKDGRLSFEEMKPVVDSLEQVLIHDDPDKPKFTNIGVDVTALDYGKYSVVKTNSFMYSFVDEPYILGKIACVKALSSLFSVGIITCNSIHITLSIPIQMTNEEIEVIMPLIMKGFRDTAAKVGAEVNGGHTAINPWCFIGGTVTSIVETNSIIKCNCATAGDVLVLTKPLGIMIALQTYHWMNRSERWNRIKLVLTEEEVIKSYKRALECMSRLNIVAARLMHTYGAHGAVEIGGCGLLGHAKELAKRQKNAVSFVIHNLPVLTKMATVARVCGNIFPLSQGTSPEISGGLLVTLPREQAASYCKEMEKEDGFQSWIIGIVEKGNKTAKIIEKPRIIEIPAKEKEMELW